MLSTIHGLHRADQGQAVSNRGCGTHRFEAADAKTTMHRLGRMSRAPILDGGRYEGTAPLA